MAEQVCDHIPCPIWNENHLFQPSSTGTRFQQKRPLPTSRTLQGYTPRLFAVYCATAQLQVSICKTNPLSCCETPIYSVRFLALYFASNHLAATKVLAELCVNHNQRAFVGKTCSDQFLPDYYVETTESDSVPDPTRSPTSTTLADTENFIVFCRNSWGKDGLVQPVITPRFVRSSGRLDFVTYADGAYEGSNLLPKTS